MSVYGGGERELERESPPWPTPALATKREPPMARAASAPLCNQIRDLRSLVVKPCAKTR